MGQLTQDRSPIQLTVWRRSVKTCQKMIRLSKAIIILGLCSQAHGVGFCHLDEFSSHPICKVFNDDPRATGWGYTPENGPSTWAANFPEVCAGTMQSPIDYKTADIVINDPGEITMTGWDTAMTGQLTNNGHSLVFDFTGEGPKPTITGGRLGSSVFEFLQLHWHWGSDSTMGSEHTVDGKMYPIEMHIVNVNQKYGTSNFASYSDGLAVLGFFYEVSSADNGNLQDLLSAVSNMATLQRIAKNRNKNKNRKGNKKNSGRADVFNVAVPTDIRLDSLICAAGVGPEYYYYQGGLTTPNCNEVVLWTSFLQTLTISENQLGVLRSLMDTDGDMFNDNFRQTQPVGTRTVAKRVPTAVAASKDVLTKVLVASGTTGGFVIGAATVLVLSAIAPLVFPPGRTARAGSNQRQTQREPRLSQFERILRAGQRLFGNP